MRIRCCTPFAEKAAGGWEINLILIAAVASLAITGAGQFSADRYLTAWFRRRRA
jgi:uncharacterized membrane protein YphA (DoxX/SURF4 family)